MAGAKEIKAVGFVPAVMFLGFPDGVTETWYQSGRKESAPSEYVDLLRVKGLLMADAVTDEVAAGANTESEGK